MHEKQVQACGRGRAADGFSILDCDVVDVVRSDVSSVPLFERKGPVRGPGTPNDRS